MKLHSRDVFVYRIRHTGSGEGPQPPEETRNRGPIDSCEKVSNESLVTNTSILLILCQICWEFSSVVFGVYMYFFYVQLFFQ